MEAQARVDSREFTEWLAFRRVYPPIEERIDLAAGILASLLCNIHGGHSKPADFLPDYTAAFRERPRSDEATDEGGEGDAIDLFFSAMQHTRSPGN